jgi:cyclopropane fatty-acyl-phospholipid synthase-like methyltransferase
VPQLKLDFSDSAPEELETFLRTINKQNMATGSALVERCDFSSTHTLVDVGGGAGGLATTIAKACAHITTTVVDLPKVTAITRKVVNEEGLGNRVAIVTADVLTSPLPGSYDAAVLKNFLQVLSPTDARRALASVSQAIKPGGTVYIVGQVLDDSRTSPPASVGFNLNFINRYETGEAYTEQEHRDWLAAAGFVDVARAKFLLPGEYGLITARKPP